MGWIYISSGVGAYIEHSRSNLVRHRKCAYFLSEILLSIAW